MTSIFGQGGRWHTFFIAVSILLACHAALAQPRLEKHREVYREALRDLSQGRLEQARAAETELRDYILFPYYELALLRAQLDEVSNATVERYLKQYQGSRVGELLRTAWIDQLRKREQWRAFLQLAGERPPAGMSCDYITALKATKQQQQANQRIEHLWHSGRRLPETCDQHLEQWLSTLSEEQQHRAHWRRAELALEKGQGKLAARLLSKLPNTEALQRLLAEPSRLYHHHGELDTDAFSHQLVVYTLKQLAHGDYLAASELWQELQPRFAFTAKENFALRNSFARQIIADDGRAARQWLARHDANLEDHYLTEWRARLAIKDGDWKTAQGYILSLPTDSQLKSDWQYWWSRADIEIHQRITPRAGYLLHRLAEDRGYYSFMAADLLGRDYQLGHSDSVKPSLISELKKDINFIRARELYELGHYQHAKAEWQQASHKLNKEQRAAAAQLALEWNWPNNAVNGAVTAGAWDNLNLRFPLAFHDDFKRNAKKQDIDLKWSFSIARQESAFAENARSPVGARGLMQLMPGTAHEAAQDMGAPPPSSDDLYNPKINIALGSFYLGSLLREFEGNRILATAAYNAGPSRIKRVLAKQQQTLAADIWIENLPYSETRHYIKNVLAYSVIYGKKLKHDQPILARHERRIHPRQELAQN